VDELERAARRDPRRPAFHFRPRAGWMNDPNGLIQHAGEFHLFYQHDPHAAVWGRMHWGHAVSRDLVHWEHLPIALAPDPGGPDRDGCFSGCAFLDDGRPMIAYTGVSPEVQCLAEGSSDLRSWRKHPANPVLRAPPAGMEVTGFRDPWVWREGGEWLMALGSGIEGRGGAVLLHRSRDLVRWEPLPPLAAGPAAPGRVVWECPCFFPLDGRHVLLVSPTPPAVSLYLVGTWQDRRFTPERQGRLDLGDSFYAPQSLLDSAGRRIAFGWLREGRSAEDQRASGWSGVLSLPRVLALGADGELRVTPAEEVTSLRQRRIAAHDALSLGSDPRELARCPTPQLEIEARVRLPAGARVALALELGAAGERVELSYDRATGELALERADASRDRSTRRSRIAGPLPLGPGEPLLLRVFLDRSVLEVYANGRCLGARVYPTDLAGAVLRAVAAPEARIEALRVFELASAG
jgi:beta-fructofuranosidase